MMAIGFLKKIDWTVLGPACFLTLLGMIEILGICWHSQNFLDFEKQIGFFAVSLAVFFVLSLVDLRVLRANSFFVFFIYLFSLILLSGLFLFGVKSRGIRAWYPLGPVSFAPVSLSIVALIIVLAKYFSSKHIELSRFRPIVVSGLYAIIPAVLVLLQPDLGSTLVLIAVWLGMVVFSGIRLKHFLILFLAFAVVFAFSWLFLFKDYQKQRILSFVNPEIDKQGIAWSANQSKIAIGSAGFLGKGVSRGAQTEYGFLSEPKTDFIFSAISEEMGLLGSFSLLLALGFLFWRVIRIAFFSENNFTRLFALGFGCYILSQTFINVGMCLGLFPVVGVPLPFVSYGGSQLLAFYAGLGLLSGLHSRQ